MAKYIVETCGDCCGGEQFCAFSVDEKGVKSEVYGHGYSPVTALEHLLHPEKAPVVRSLTEEEVLEGYKLLQVADVGFDNLNVEVEPLPEPKEFKPMELVKNQVIEFIDGLAPQDKVLVSISTEIYAGMTNDGAEKKAGDIYLALAIKKCNEIPEGFVLQDTMDYPAKIVYNKFQEVK